MTDVPDWVKPRKRDENDHDPRRVRENAPKPLAPRPNVPPKPKAPPKPKTWKDVQTAREKKKGRGKEARPIGMDSVCLGEVTVIFGNPKAILIIGGDTTGENWIPRSQILDGPLDRDAKKDDVGEIWLPQWLADKVPWT